MRIDETEWPPMKFAVREPDNCRLCTDGTRKVYTLLVGGDAMKDAFTYVCVECLRNLRDAINAVLGPET